MEGVNIKESPLNNPDREKALTFIKAVEEVKEEFAYTDHVVIGLRLHVDGTWIVQWLEADEGGN